VSRWQPRKRVFFLASAGAIKGMDQPPLREFCTLFNLRKDGYGSIRGGFQTWLLFLARLGRGTLLLLAVLGLPCQTKLWATSQQGAIKDFQTLSSEANAARDANQLDQAAILYEKALALRPTWTQGWWSLGTILYDQNAYRRAANSFRKVVEQDTKNGTAWAMLGLCEFELGHSHDALAHLERGVNFGIAKDPQLLKVIVYHEGVLFEREGEFETAYEKLAPLCEEGVESPNLYRTLGMIAFRIPHEDAETRTSPGEEIVMHLGQAECLAAQNKFEEAGRKFQTLVEQYPEFPKIHYAYGKLLLQLHDTSDAKREFEKEIEGNPQEVLSRLEIAAIEYRVDSVRGISYAQEALKLDPQLPFGHYLLGLLLLDTHQYEKALRELEVARPALAAVPNIYFALGTAYSRLGRKHEAARAWATFRRLNQGTEKSGPLYYGQQHLGLQGKLGP